MSVKTKNVRITLDLPPELHREIKILASQNGETLRQLFIDLAKAKIADKEFGTIEKNLKIPVKIPQPVALGVDEVDLQKIIDESSWPKF